MSNFNKLLNIYFLICFFFKDLLGSVTETAGQIGRHTHTCRERKRKRGRESSHELTHSQMSTMARAVSG